MNWGAVDVLKTWGKGKAFMNMSGTGVYGAKSHADLTCLMVVEVPHGLKWVFPSGQLAGECESDLPQRAEAIGEVPKGSQAARWGAQRRKVAHSPVQNDISKSLIFGFHNQMTPSCDKGCDKMARRPSQP
jgi:hypothetical protein